MEQATDRQTSEGTLYAPDQTMVGINGEWINQPGGTAQLMATAYKERIIANELQQIAKEMCPQLRYDLPQSESREVVMYDQRHIDFPKREKLSKEPTEDI